MRIPCRMPEIEPRASPTLHWRTRRTFLAHSRATPPRVKSFASSPRYCPKAPPTRHNKTNIFILTDDRQLGIGAYRRVQFGRPHLALVLGVVLQRGVGDLQIVDALRPVAQHRVAREARYHRRETCWATCATYIITLLCSSRCLSR